MSIPRNAAESLAMEAGIAVSTAHTWIKQHGMRDSASFPAIDAALKAQAAMADLAAVESIDETDIEDLATDPEPLDALDDLVETRAERHLQAQMYAHLSWAKTEDPTERTRPAREAFQAKFEREVDPDGVLAPAERAKRAEHARKAYYLRLSLASAKARRERKQAKS